MKIIDEFKEFAIRGNAIDLAVGIIIGAGFSKIVTSLVEDVIMPPIGLLVGDTGFTNYEFILRGANDTAEAVTLNYGTFISTILEFIVIAFAIFMVVRYINKLKRSEAGTEAGSEPAPRTCPFCKEGIAHTASRCPHCTAKLSSN